MAGNFALYGVGGAVLVSLVVQLIKRLFPFLRESDRAQVAVVLLVGLVLSAASHLVRDVPGVAYWVRVVVDGLLVACISMGMYDVAHHAGRGR